jgi:hypothetical protein
MDERGQSQDIVMAGACPGHPRLALLRHKDVDARHKAGHDDK